MRKRKKHNRVMLCAGLAGVAGFALGWAVSLLAKGEARTTGPAAPASSPDAGATKVLGPASSLNPGTDLDVGGPKPEAESLLVLDPATVRRVIESDDPGRMVPR